MSLEVDSDVPMPTNIVKRGPRPNKDYAKLDDLAIADIEVRKYRNALEAAKAYLFCYYPGCKDEQRNDKIRDIRSRLDDKLNN